MIYISTCTDPFINLSLEHHLFEYTSVPALFLYQNSPCVVIGRAQNPWVECDLHFLDAENIPLLRRQSGGGTVFHDLGNLNFTFFSAKAHLDKKHNLKLVLQALMLFGVCAELNDRHDLLLADKKISGSAFRETRSMAFHHGTLLLASHLEILRRSLKAPAYHIKSKGVASVKSSVTNINDHHPQLAMSDLQAALIERFRQYYQITAPIQYLNEFDTVKATLQLYHSDAWRFERSLPFSETLKHQDGSQSTLEVEAGIITQIETKHPELLRYLSQPYHNFYRERSLCKLA